MTAKKDLAPDVQRDIVGQSHNADWEMCHVKRIKAPPLRFKGKKMAHHSLTHGDKHIFVTLWARRKGDYVVAFTEQENDTISPNAIQAETIRAAAMYLEGKCFHHTTQWPDITLIPLKQMLFTIGYRQKFLELVGWALSDWESHAESTAANSPD
jgi:hypothetical protein